MELKEVYTKKILPELTKELNIKNKLSAPKIKKVIVNVGVGRLSKAQSFKDKILPKIIQDISVISGQMPSLSRAKKSISGFKVREGDVVGLKATLRGARMYDLIDKIVKIAFPRLRDFRGVDLKSVDNSGNLNIGFKGHNMFPEIDQDVPDVEFGFQITISTDNIKNRSDAILLYKKLGFLFKDVADSKKNNKNK